MKIAIITGATGYIGSNLCRTLLKNNWNVNVIVRKKSKYEYLEDIKDKLNIFLYNDELDKLIKYFQKVNANVVFHLASNFIVQHKSSEISGLIRSNIEFGSHILEAMSQSKTRLLINTGTSWQHYQNDNYNPVCLYAATKQAFEAIIEYYIQAENIRVITLKLFDTYGANDKRPKLINLLKKITEEKIELDMSPGEQLIDLVYIDDVINAFIKAYEYLANDVGVIYKKFGVSSGTGINLKDLISLYEQILCKETFINWGAREYRKREVLILWRSFEKLPNWKCNVGLEEGLKKISSNSI